MLVTTFVAFDYQTIATLLDIKVNYNSSICPVITVTYCYYSFFIYMKTVKENVQFRYVMISMLIQISIGNDQQLLSFFLFPVIN